MALIASWGTRPELAVRSLLHRLGYRFRLQDEGLPGTPDIVFKRRRKVIFVHGCFWHRHGVDGCRLTRTPKTRLDLLGGEVCQEQVPRRSRFKRIERFGVAALVIWECHVRGGSMVVLEERLRDFLGPPRDARLMSGIAPKTPKHSF